MEQIQQQLCELTALLNVVLQNDNEQRKDAEAKLN